MMAVHNDEEAERFIIGVWYESPWERPAARMWGIDQHGNMRGEVRDGSLRDWIACWADGRDRKWIARYVRRGRRPHKRWERRVNRERT